MNLVAWKDNKTLAGIDNIEVHTKAAIAESLDLIETTESQHDDAHDSDRKTHWKNWFKGQS